MKRLVAAVTLSAIALAASAHEYHAGKILIGHPWARAMPANSPTGAVYFTLDNQGNSDDKLVQVDTPRAKSAELHNHINDQGVMRMRKVEGGVTIPAGGKVVFAPGKYHVMLFSPTAELKAGERFPMKLHFEKAGDVEVQVVVEKDEPHGH